MGSTCCIHTTSHHTVNPLIFKKHSYITRTIISLLLAIRHLSEVLLLTISCGSLANTPQPIILFFCLAPQALLAYLSQHIPLTKGALTFFPAHLVQLPWHAQSTNAEYDALED